MFIIIEIKVCQCLAMHSSDEFSKDNKNIVSFKLKFLLFVLFGWVKGFNFITKQAPAGHGSDSSSSKWMTSKCLNAKCLNAP